MEKPPKYFTDLEEWEDYVWRVLFDGRKKKTGGYSTKDNFSYYNLNALRMRCSYIYAKQWVEGSTYDEMLKLAWDEGKIKRRRKDYSPFSLAVKMLFNNVDDSTRNRYGKVLEYAYLHAVPSKWLLGFIVQCGGLEVVTKKHRRNHKEDWYKNRKATKWQGRLERFNAKKSDDDLWNTDEFDSDE